MKSLLKVVLSFGVLLLAGASHAADQDDIYIEFSGGSHFKFSSELMADASIGYLPIDGVGGGIYFGQEFGTVQRFSEISGSLVGLEGRWFLEPFEVSLVLGRFFKSSDSYNFLQAGSCYLYALTPALAAKVEAKARLNVGEDWVFSLGVGGRLLF